MFDIVVVGSGIAGLYATLKAAKFARVCLITKGALHETNTWLAQGGIAAALGEDDNPDMHLADTVRAGAGACDPKAVSILVQEGPLRVKDLLDLGTPFDVKGNSLALTWEGAHSRNRILHCGGDATGRMIQTTLLQQLVNFANVTVRDNTFATDLIMSEGMVSGIRTLCGQFILAKAVILATGGLGQVYSRTTNPAVATGDGVAMAYRAGARVADMEFIQFHPTVFLGKSEKDTFLISEALRGEGAVLRNQDGMRFMENYHSLAEMGPRDVVARAILDQMKNHNSEAVYLDIAHRSRDFLKKRFPTIYSLSEERGYDLATQWLPVAPAAHYAMGGVLTDPDGQTNIAGLYACGEVACSGVHGANRLASNSLLEGLVFSYRAVQSILQRHMGNKPVQIKLPTYHISYHQPNLTDEIKKNLQKLMFQHAGLLRDGFHLAALQDDIKSLEQKMPLDPADRQEWELVNLITTARLIAEGALLRTESRGGHYRLDFPQTNPELSRFPGVIRQKEEEACATSAI